MDRKKKTKTKTKTQKKERRRKQKLPFYIVLGHLDEITEKLGEDESNEMILEDTAWILIKNQGKRLIWVIDPAIKNLKNNFMMYKDPIVYIFFNYHVKGMIEHLEEELRKVKSLGIVVYNRDGDGDGEGERDGEREGERDGDGEGDGDEEGEEGVGVKINIIGFNYNNKKAKMRKLREEVLEWCDGLNYQEFNLKDDLESIFQD